MSRRSTSSSSLASWSSTTCCTLGSVVYPPAGRPKSDIAKATVAVGVRRPTRPRTKCPLAALPSKAFGWPTRSSARNRPVVRRTLAPRSSTYGPTSTLPGELREFPKLRSQPACLRFPVTRVRSSSSDRKFVKVSCCPESYTKEKLVPRGNFVDTVTASALRGSVTSDPRFDIPTVEVTDAVGTPV